MTRKEEINQAAHQKYPYEGGMKGLICESSIPIFIQGAEWADKTMIEKVLNFIYENFYDHPHVNGHICTDSFQSLEKLEEELIKTIEL